MGTGKMGMRRNLLWKTHRVLVEAYELMLELAKGRLHFDVKKNYEEMLSAGLLNDKKPGRGKR